MIDFPAFGLTAPDGSIIGVIEEGGASGLIQNVDAGVLTHDALSRLDAVQKAQTVTRLVQQRRAGGTVILLTHDEPLLESCADEIWWLRGDKLIARGHPAEVFPAYRRHVAQVLRESGRNQSAELAPALRDGDGRAQLQTIELLGADGAPAVVWRSGETVAIRVTFRYGAEVADPVIGILIRTRIGLNVYGTNTELENIRFGPTSAGDSVRVTYRFRCDLCPGDYTVTAASHDPDGVWHDWLEDAVAFAVSDNRYSAGVANLRAQVAAEVLPRT
jgi:lipopolysaccharide transport system ATP-binding protein